MLYLLEPNNIKCTSNERKARVVQSGVFFRFSKAVEKVVCVVSGNCFSAVRFELV
jgi:hypothetical protein